MTKRLPMPAPHPAPPTTPPPPVVPPPPPATSSTPFLPAAPLPITRDTPFRATGDVSEGVWHEQFELGNTPLPESVQWEMWRAAQGVSALVLDRLRIESAFCRNTAAHNNCLGLRVPGTLAFQKFDSPVDAVKELVRRWSDPTYKNGVYYPKDLSLAKMLAKYSPPSENNTEMLIADSVSTINRWRGSQSSPTSPPPPTPTGITYGRVPVPKNFTDRQIPDAQNHAWDNLGQRVLRGIVYHRMLGTLWGTDAYFRQNAPGLTDWGVDHNTGEILRWNDYKGRPGPGISPNRAPWASGPWNNVPGDGMAFVQTFGVNGINRDLSAIEISGNYDTPLSNAGMDAIVALSAYLADQAHIPWDTYPVVPATGLVFTYWHADFTTEKPCPGAVIKNATPVIIERTADMLEHYQTGG